MEGILHQLVYEKNHLFHSYLTVANWCRISSTVHRTIEAWKHVPFLGGKNHKGAPHCRFIESYSIIHDCQVAYLLILEGNKRFHYTISGVECNKRFTRTLQCAKRFFRLFGENLVNSPGFHQVFTRFWHSPRFHQVLQIHQDSISFHQDKVHV